MKSLHTITFVLIVVGAINWGLDALNWNVVDLLGPGIAKIVYLLVGLSGLYEAITHKNYCKNCNPKMGGQSM